MLRELRDRLLSAAVLVPIVVAAAWFGHPWLTLFLAVALGLAAWEFGVLGRQLGHRVFPAVPTAFAAILALGRGYLGPGYSEHLLVLAVVLVTIWQVLAAHTGTRTEAWAITILAGVFVGFLGSYLISLRQLPNGLAWLGITVFTVWVGDTAAYATGRLFGRHKLAPLISPGKTWQGSAGELVAAIITGTVLGAIWLEPVHGLAIGLIAGLITPFADLAKSMLKRQVGVKDSSSLIPGHGGALDRLDTLLFAAPLVFCYAVLVAGVLPPAG